VSSVIQWRRSRRCESGNCVEFARIGESFAIRDSKDINSPILTFESTVWTDFVDGVRAGHFSFK
jgi:Domain of unknown function (DUF397)